MSKYDGEQVLVIPRNLFEELGVFQGYKTDTEGYLGALLNPKNNFFMDRELAEGDPTHKQLIPYAIFKAKDKILCYERGQSGGEGRLHAKLSLGVGGHINPVDSSADPLGEETYYAAVNREFSEELNIQTNYQQSILGLVNDDANEVGKVHLGVVHLVELDSEEVTANEKGIANLQFRTIQQLNEPEIFDRLESWSQIALSMVNDTLVEEA